MFIATAIMCRQSQPQLLSLTYSFIASLSKPLNFNVKCSHCKHKKAQFPGFFRDFRETGPWGVLIVIIKSQKPIMH